MRCSVYTMCKLMCQPSCTQDCAAALLQLCKEQKLHSQLLAAQQQIKQIFSLIR